MQDPAAAVREALSRPIGFPALRESVVSSDRVAVTLEDGLVQPVEVVTGIVQELLAAQIEPAHITLIRSARDAHLWRGDLTRKLPEDVRTLIQVRVHDPTDRADLCLLNVAHDDRPIYLNREIVEADLVLPVGMFRPRGSRGYLGVQGTWFPAFADQETQQRFLTPQSMLSPAELRRRCAEAPKPPGCWAFACRCN